MVAQRSALLSTPHPLSVCAAFQHSCTLLVCTFECMLSSVHAPLKAGTLIHACSRSPSRKLCVSINVDQAWVKWFMETFFPSWRWFSSFSWKDSLKVTFDQVMSKAEVVHLGLKAFSILPQPALSFSGVWLFHKWPRAEVWRVTRLGRTCMLPCACSGCWEWIPQGLHVCKQE